MIHQLGLDQPFFVQYATHAAALYGNFGISFRPAQPVASSIANVSGDVGARTAASVLATLMGIPLGVYTGIYRNSPLHGCSCGQPDRRFAAGFLLGILLILIFAVD